MDTTVIGYKLHAPTASLLVYTSVQSSIWQLGIHTVCDKKHFAMLMNTDRAGTMYMYIHVDTYYRLATAYKYMYTYASYSSFGGYLLAFVAWLVL